MATWTLTQTSAGLELQAKVIARCETLSFTRVVTSPDAVDLENLKEQTQISTIKQVISINGLDSKDNTFTIHGLLKNDGLEEDYYLRQIGFYATDPDGGEVLYAIAQLDEARKIPKSSDSPGFGINFSFAFASDTAMDVNVTIDSDSFMTYEAVELLIAESLENEKKAIEKMITESIDEIIELAEDITEE